MNSLSTLNGIALTAPTVRRQDEVLTREALDFVRALHQHTETRRQELLARRGEQRALISRGSDPGFLPETRHIREDAAWQVAPVAPGLADRRVEITGPVDRKMAINALNSGANVWLADLEDSLTPSWSNIVNGQLNLQDALNGTLSHTTPEGKHYTVGCAPMDCPTIVVRPRGLHLPEQHVLIDGVPVAGGLFDFGMHFFHNARTLLHQGRGPYFYLPKIENHLEARLWNEIFVLAQRLLGIPRGTIRATVLIETITAAFEMEEILYELRDHSSGLNAGRWDYIFSVIKNFGTRGARFVLPDRNMVTMTAPFMRAYTDQLVRACHRRGAHAIGGPSAFVPNRRDHAANSVAFEKMRAEKTREAKDGFDGAWVAHPDLVPVAREVFDSVLGRSPNQLSRSREDVVPQAKALLDIAGTPGIITEQGIRSNLEIGVRYIESWLRGNGAMAINDLMEDAATAEISRSQIWQWIHASAITEDGEIITQEWVAELLEEVFSSLERFEGDRFEDAVDIFEDVSLGTEFPAFLTVAAYERYFQESLQLIAA